MAWVNAAPAGPILRSLRFTPETACAKYAFTCVGAPLGAQMGGSCKLSISPRSSIYQIEVKDKGTDYFIPYGNGSARYCDVPKGTAKGTLVVTASMNGCALEVRQDGDTKRFYHDADGKFMPASANAFGEQVYRVEFDRYAGPNRTAETVYLGAMQGADPMENPMTGGYSHFICCVREDDGWGVYQTAMVQMTNHNTGSSLEWGVRGGGLEVKLGSFAD